MLMGNVVVNTFIQGGPIMWPLLLCSLVAVGVIAERVFWWANEAKKFDPERLERIYDALAKKDLAVASGLARNSADPRIAMIWQGLNHHHHSMRGAMEVEAGDRMEKAAQGLSILDTIITLGPLLGLLGTVTGIMHSFNFVGAEEVAAVKVSGGIAEALIATACGLAIAILALIPFNYFNRRLSKLRFQLENAATNVEVLLGNKADEETPPFSAEPAGRAVVLASKAEEAT